MKPILLLALFLWQSMPQPASTGHPNLRYRRTLELSAAGPACAVIDPAIFPHAAPSLKDLRLYSSTDPTRELPYVITLSEPRQPDADTAQVRNLTLRQRNIVFDVEMPHRPYTTVTLNLAGHDFLAIATVSGARDPNYTRQTHLGDFTLFDLTHQHLARVTSFQLQETDLPYLHIELAVSPLLGSPAPTPQALLAMVQGVTVPPSREAQSLYTTALTSSLLTQSGSQAIASFTLPERIPIERISFDLAPTYTSNFSRIVHVTDSPASTLNTSSTQQNDRIKRSKDVQNGANSTPPTPDPISETSAATIFRVHLTQDGHEIRQQQLTVPVTLGSNMQSPANVQVSVDNGDAPPLPLTAIRLEMRQHKLCFDAPSASPLTLFYGDPTLQAPEYNLLWNPAVPPQTVHLGPEQLNPAYHAHTATAPLTERHPSLIWLALLAVLSIPLISAIRSSRTHHHRQGTPK